MYKNECQLCQHLHGALLISARLTIVANVAIAVGPALIGAPQSSVINHIYNIIYKIFSV